MNIIIILLRICHVEKLLVWHKALLHVRGIKFIALAEIVLFFCSACSDVGRDERDSIASRTVFAALQTVTRLATMLHTKTGTVYVNYNMALLPIQ